MKQKRYKAGRLESAISLSIMFILIGIATAIFFQQFRYSRAILRGEQAISYRAASNSQQSKLLARLPLSLTPLSAPEVFEPLNLSDKINGKAGLYLSAGFKRLESQRFIIDGTSDDWMEVFIYDMGSSENAFSVFSAQQREDAEPAGLGKFSYRTPNALYWIHGPYYVEIIGARPSEENTRGMQHFAEAFIQNIKVETKSMAERELFPTKGLEKNNIMLIPTDAFGYEGFDRVYTAGYKIGDAELSAFISQRQTAAQAQQLASNYHQFLMAFGGENRGTNASIENARIVMILDTYEVIFSQGPYVAGVREAAEIAQAIDLALKLKERIEAVSKP
ncbi:MAG: hypothetical protein PVI06_03055 [Desulfobacterales bacterium]